MRVSACASERSHCHTASHGDAAGTDANLKKRFPQNVFQVPYGDMPCARAHAQAQGHTHDERTRAQARTGKQMTEAPCGGLRTVWLRARPAQTVRRPPRHPDDLRAVWLRARPAQTARRPSEQHHGTTTATATATATATDRLHSKGKGKGERRAGEGATGAGGAGAGGQQGQQHRAEHEREREREVRRESGRTGTEPAAAPPPPPETLAPASGGAQERRGGRAAQRSQADPSRGGPGQARRGEGESTYAGGFTLFRVPPDPHESDSESLPPDQRRLISGRGAGQGRPRTQRGWRGQAAMASRAAKAKDRRADRRRWRRQLGGSGSSDRGGRRDGDDAQSFQHAASPTPGRGAESIMHQATRLEVPPTRTAGACTGRGSRLKIATLSVKSLKKKPPCTYK